MRQCLPRLHSPFPVTVHRAPIAVITAITNVAMAPSPCPSGIDRHRVHPRFAVPLGPVGGQAGDHLVDEAGGQSLVGERAGQHRVRDPAAHGVIGGRREQARPPRTRTARVMARFRVPRLRPGRPCRRALGGGPAGAGPVGSQAGRGYGVHNVTVQMPSPIAGASSTTAAQLSGPQPVARKTAQTSRPLRARLKCPYRTRGTGRRGPALPPQGTVDDQGPEHVGPDRRGAEPAQERRDSQRPDMGRRVPQQTRSPPANLP